MRYKYFR